MSPFTVIVVALAAEAKPLREHWRLSHVQNTVYRCWQNDDMLLVESGVGKCNAAAATASTLTQLVSTGLNTRQLICVNYGIAGGSYDLGTVLTAQSVTDSGSGERWYPSLTFGPQTTTTDLVCVDTPDTNYRTGDAFDMESSGFYTAARRYVSHEFLHCLKCISDNPENDLQAITKDSVSTLIRNSLSSLSLSLKQLTDLHAELFDTGAINAMMDDLNNTLHITSTQGHQLQRLLERHVALHGSLPAIEPLLSLKRTPQLIQSLTEQLDSQTPQY